MDNSHTPTLKERQLAADIWNGWTNNYSRKNDGYIIHAFDDKESVARKTFKSLCGVELQETGLIQLGEECWSPGCLKCRAILKKRGLL
jgi:hypothetical protein